MLPSSKFSRLALGVAFLFLGLLIQVVATAGRQPHSQFLSDVLQAGMVVCATLCAAHVTGRSLGYLRRLWLLFAVSLLFVVLAQVIETYYESLAHTPFERSGIALEIDISPGFPRMPQEAEIAFFRIVQESLANIQRHSGSPTGRIRLWNGQGSVQLEISDQGCGIAAVTLTDGSNGQKVSRLGVGILGMRERMTQLGGTLEVQSDASGTTVRATIPLVLEGADATPSHSRGG